MNAIQALLVENRIIVCNIEHSRELLAMASMVNH